MKDNEKNEDDISSFPKLTKISENSSYQQASLGVGDVRNIKIDWVKMSQML